MKGERPMSVGRNEYRDPSNYDVVGIPIEQVQPGFSLVFDRGEGPQLFPVEEVGFSPDPPINGLVVRVSE